MIKTINLNAEIPLSRELNITLTLPSEIPVGPAEIAVTVSSPSQPKARTLADLARSEFFGIWRDRDDLKDSLGFAKMLRSEGWSRVPDDSR
jgi:hypothetical protein